MRLALAQINPTVGDLSGNSKRLISFIEQARRRGAHLVVFPELALCGYPPKDLLMQQGFLEDCARAADHIGTTATAGLTVVFGSPTRGPAGGIGNSLLVYRDNAPLAAYDKRLLPTYDVFDEDRYFTPGEQAVVIDVAANGEKHRVGLAICEDLWKGEDVGFASRYADCPDPVGELAAAGAKIVVVPSASPFALGKGKRHRAILRSHASRHNVWVASVNQVGGNDDLLFDGHAALFAPGGALAAAAGGFEEELLVADLPSAAASGGGGGGGGGACEDPILRASDEELVWRALVMGVGDYVRKTGFGAAIIGLSGGIDSALTAAIAAAALGPANVTGVLMPGPYSSSHASEDAIDLAQRLGIGHVTLPIEKPVQGFRACVDPVFAQLGLAALGRTLPDLAEENLQSRARGTALMALSNRSGAIVLTTGNKSELAVGYCTLYGDMNGGLAVLSDVSKQLVYRLSRWVNANPGRAGFKSLPIPQRSIEKPPSAELRPDQTDQDSLPPYDVLDEIIDRYIERRQSPRTIAQESGFDAALVAKIVRMIDASEYKRKQAAVGLRVTGLAFGSGRRFPIAQRYRPGV